MNEVLIGVLTEVVNADHFGDDLYQRVFRALSPEKKTNKLLTSIANTLEEYYNCHNRWSLLGRRRQPIAPEAESEKEDLELYLEALCQGLTDFRSIKHLKSRLQRTP